MTEHWWEKPLAALNRQEWEALEGLSAHGVGHFGSYVYKPSGALANLDSGVMPFTGKVVRVDQDGVCETIS